ncbi:hypothetical protein EDE08_10241 [Bradyrhizobium sp. R2.2-H]|jgi:hypothetical protein|nr:hypothetical protein EDE10_10241 [Bradyrhizobium sp. Y-H1]TCU79578.1 hypothetical protein EDE08_10241 [Bradyrhizobium sp. R2.2-H]
MKTGAAGNETIPDTSYPAYAEHSSGLCVLGQSR